MGAMQEGTLCHDGFSDAAHNSTLQPHSLATDGTIVAPRIERQKTILVTPDFIIAYSISCLKEQGLRVMTRSPQLRSFETETSRKIAQCIGKNLAKIRLERGLTKGDFAKELGISEPVYLAIEAGKNNLTIQTIGGIAEHLRVSAVGLMLEPERIY
jgi:DNA-binding XRE family transcriptional regulator